MRWATSDGPSLNEQALRLKVAGPSWFHHPRLAILMTMKEWAIPSNEAWDRLPADEKAEKIAYLRTIARMREVEQKQKEIDERRRADSRGHK